MDSGRSGRGVSQRQAGFAGARLRPVGWKAGRVPEALKKITVQVCTTCRAEGEPLEPREQRSGARLFEALQARRREGDPEIVGIECFSVCRRPCTISFSAEGAWTYVYGDFPADTEPEEILAAARLYGASPEGLIPWKERPTALKKGVVARLPPSRSSQ
jgi:predicted metal-binding protein